MLLECPYLIKNDENHAHCGLVADLIGLSPSPITKTTKEACTFCQQRFQPSKSRLNPVVASLLHRATDKIIKEKGIGGCDLRRGMELRKFAEKFLDAIPGTVDTRKEKHPAVKIPCYYFGKQTGEKPCKTCRGNVRLKVYVCHHELHDETTIRECERCDDYDGQLADQKVQSWAVGVTTAPRDPCTLKESLRSLENAGWKDYLLFAEPDSSVPDGVDGARLRQRANALGAWPNFYMALTELMLTQPHADAYLMCQDDVLYCKGLRDYLENVLWPGSRPGVVALHTPMHQDIAAAKGFYASPQGWAAWGAQAYVFPNAAARAFVRHPRVVNHRNRGPREGLCNVDSMVGQWCQDVGFDYYLHSPSPTQHIGEKSTLWENSNLEGRRSAATFPGEDVDINDWMTKEFS